MEEKISVFLNEIIYFIHEDKIRSFIKTVKRFGKENNMKININTTNNMVCSETEIKTQTKLSPDLKKRLFETINYINNEDLYDEREKLENEIKKIHNESLVEEIVPVCKNILNYLDINKKRNKRFYYTVGSYFSIIKSKFETEKEFLAYAKREFDRSSTTLKDYIRFYNTCNEYDHILFCNLTYREIIKNYSEIITLLKSRQVDS